MTKHLAIFSKGIGELILDGKKNIESRFSRVKLSPFNVVSTGDLVYIKPSGKEPIGQFRVKKVISFDGLNPEDLEEIRQKYGKQIIADDRYWNSHKQARYGTLIFIGETSKFITSPVKFNKKDLRGWVVLN